MQYLYACFVFQVPKKLGGPPSLIPEVSSPTQPTKKKIPSKRTGESKGNYQVIKD